LIWFNVIKLVKSSSRTFAFDMLCSQCYSIFLRKNSLVDSYHQDQTISLSRTQSKSDCSLCALLKARFIRSSKRRPRNERAQDVTLKYWLQDGDEKLQEEPYWFHFEDNDTRAGSGTFNILLIPQQGDLRRDYGGILSSLLTFLRNQPKPSWTTFKCDEFQEKP
jgi:hypothetical protein